MYKLGLLYFPLLPFLEENQYDLLKNNGLPLMIQVLTESQDEELSKAATFVLQNCKQMSKLSVMLLKKLSEMFLVCESCWHSKKILGVGVWCSVIFYSCLLM